MHMLMVIGQIKRLLGKDVSCKNCWFIERAEVHSNPRKARRNKMNRPRAKSANDVGPAVMALQGFYNPNNIYGPGVIINVPSEGEDYDEDEDDESQVESETPESPAVDPAAVTTDYFGPSTEDKDDSQARPWADVQVVYPLAAPAIQTSKTNEIENGAARVVPRRPAPAFGPRCPNDLEFDAVG